MGGFQTNVCEQACISDFFRIPLTTYNKIRKYWFMEGVLPASGAIAFSIEQVGGLVSIISLSKVEHAPPMLGQGKPPLSAD